MVHIRGERQGIHFGPDVLPRLQSLDSSVGITACVRQASVPANHRAPSSSEYPGEINRLEACSGFQQRKSARPHRTIKTATDVKTVNPDPVPRVVRTLTVGPLLISVPSLPVLSVLWLEVVTEALLAPVGDSGDKANPCVGVGNEADGVGDGVAASVSVGVGVSVDVGVGSDVGVSIKSGVGVGVGVCTLLLCGIR